MGCVMNADDAMLRQVLSTITSELAQGREYMQSAVVMLA